MTEQDPHTGSVRGSAPGTIGEVTGLRPLVRAAAALARLKTAALDLDDEFVLLVDLDGNAVYNAPASTSTGAPAGYDHTELVWEVSRLDGTPVPPEEWPIARAFRGEILRDEEFIVAGQFRSPHRVRFRVAAPVRDEAGQIIGVVCRYNEVCSDYEVPCEHAAHCGKGGCGG